MTPKLPAPPAWLKDCALDSHLSARDVRALIGVTYNVFERMLREGSWPRPDHRATGSSCPFKRLWTVGLVLRTLNEAQSGGA